MAASGIRRRSSLQTGSSHSLRRKSSIISDSGSLRSSTDDLFLPSFDRDQRLAAHDESSHLHSAPLALALLPAIGGLFFENGSAVVTDITLLALAAVFLNWSVRLPWKWYLSAQELKSQYEGQTYDSEFPDAIIEESDEEEDTAVKDKGKEKEIDTPVGEDKSRQRTHRTAVPSTAVQEARKELQLHELLALALCFIAPALGTWLLHVLRSQLSRPSEGLVSNYNLTIFLLASEIRPLSHLVKLVQARTLHLQRLASSSPFEIEHRSTSPYNTSDLTRRLDELESHIAITAEARANDPDALSPSDPKARDRTRATIAAEVRKGLQPEVDAVSRAVRRYEKRTTLTTLQTDARLRELEAQIRDAVSLSAAAIAGQQSRNSMLGGLVATGWEWGKVVAWVPVQVGIEIVSVPGKVFSWVLEVMKSVARKGGNGADGEVGKRERGQQSQRVKAQGRKKQF